MKITTREDALEAARAGAVLVNADETLFRMGVFGWEVFVLGTWEPIPGDSGPTDGETFWVIGRTGR